MCAVKTCVLITTADLFHLFSRHISQKGQPATASAAFLFTLQPALEMQEQDENMALKVSSKANTVFALAGNTNENMRCFSLGWRIYKSKTALSLFTMQNPPCISSTLPFATDAEPVSLERSAAQTTTQIWDHELLQPAQHASSF